MKFTCISIEVFSNGYFSAKSCTEVVEQSVHYSLACETCLFAWEKRLENAFYMICIRYTMKSLLKIRFQWYCKSFTMLIQNGWCCNRLRFIPFPKSLLIMYLMMISFAFALNIILSLVRWMANNPISFFLFLWAKNPVHLDFMIICEFPDCTCNRRQVKYLLNNYKWIHHFIYDPTWWWLFLRLLHKL